jgi:hypothetical protein
LPSESHAEVVSRLAALSLLPENSRQGDGVRTVVEAGLADPTLTTAAATSKLSLAPGGLTSVLSQAPRSGDAFCEELVFTGGSYLLSSHWAASSYALRHLTKAIWSLQPPMSDHAFSREMRELIGGTLSLSDVACRSVGLERLMPEVVRQTSAVVTPPAARWRDLAAAVRFDPGRLDEATGPWSAHFDPLLWRAGDEVWWRPLVRLGEELVIASPRTLADGLCHAVVAETRRRGLTPELARRFSESVWDTVTSDLQMLGYDPLASDLESGRSNVRHGVFRMDTDKAIHVVCAVDDLNGWTESNCGFWRGPDPGEIETLLDDMTERLWTEHPAPNEILQLVVVCSAGRPATAGLRKEGDELGPRTMLTAHELQTIARVEHGKPLLLHKWSKAATRLRQTAHVVRSDPLDEFALWRTNDYSYYVGDSPPPEQWIIDPDSGASLRREALLAVDPHGLPGPLPNSLVDVVRANRNPDEPIYLPWPVDILDTFSLAVGGLDIPIWVMAPQIGQGTGLDAELFRQTEMLAYWLWQFSPVLGEVTGAIASFEQAVVIRVSLTGSVDDWRSVRIPDGVPAETRPGSGHELDFIIHPASTQAMLGPDNAGERKLCAILLVALREMAGLAVWSQDELNDFLDRYAPLGPKRKITRLNSAEAPELDPGQLPRSRGRSKADSATVQDDLGEHLRRSGWPIGSVADTKRGQILNAAADSHAHTLARMVASLSPEWLAHLIIDHEALLYEQAERELTLTSRIACYGDQEHFVSQLRDQVPQLAATALAARFLIEFVAARPPRGLRPYSRDAHDLLLALADETASRGYASDLVKHGLDDPRVSMLPSGRLGYSREGAYDRGRAEFLGRFADDAVANTAATYGDRWEPHEDADPATIAALNAATQAEFGLTLQAQVEFLVLLAELGHEIAGEAKHLSRSKLQSLFGREGWNSGDIDRAVGLLSLRPRPDFWATPGGFERFDVYPWRMNRALSFIRRPLVVAERDGDDVIWWGNRHADAAGKYLVDLCNGGRLRATSAPMIDLLSELRDRAAEQFNDDVADDFERAANFVAQRRVIKLGGRRLCRPNGELIGDIDVLVAEPASWTLWAIDTKHLAPGRAPHEIANEVKSTFIVGGSKRSKADIHVERLAFLDAHRSEALGLLGLPSMEAGRWETRGLFVVSNEMVGPYLTEMPFQVISYRTMKEWIDA